MFNRVNLKRMAISIFMVLCTAFFNVICCFASEPPKENIDSNKESTSLEPAVDNKTSNRYESAKLKEYIDAWFIAHLYDNF